MPEYRVVRGTHRREDGTRAEQGDMVELSEEQRDRYPAESFERVSEPDDEVDEDEDVAPTPSEEADQTEDTVEEESEASSTESPDEDDEEAVDDVDLAPSLDHEGEENASGDLPDDWEMLQAMASVYEGDEVDGRSDRDSIEETFSEFSDTEVAVLKDKAEDHLYADPDDA